MRSEGWKERICQGIPLDHRFLYTISNVLQDKATNWNMLEHEACPEGKKGKNVKRRQYPAALSAGGRNS